MKTPRRMQTVVLQPKQMASPCPDIRYNMTETSGLRKRETEKITDIY